MRVISILSIIVVFLTACQTVPEASSKIVKPGNLIDCPIQRSSMCTMIYKPVCAMDKAGQFATYSSDCTACSHAEVIGYQEGACP